MKKEKKVSTGIDIPQGYFVPGGKTLRIANQRSLWLTPTPRVIIPTAYDGKPNPTVFIQISQRKEALTSRRRTRRFFSNLYVQVDRECEEARIVSISKYPSMYWHVF